MTISFRVPLLPPSVNHYKSPRKGGGWFVSKEAKAFIEAVQLLAPKTSIPRGSLIEVRVKYFIQRQNFLRVDLDNLGKLTFDSPVKAALISDDRYIKRIEAEKFPVMRREDEGTVFEITQMLPL